MSNLHKCGACGGTYMDPQPDGSRYYHACPEAANKAYQPDATKPDYDPRETVRPDGARDENILPQVEVHDGKHVLLSSDPNDAQKQMATPTQNIAKQPGDGREAVSA